MDKEERYRALVMLRKAYDPTPFGLSNPSAAQFREFDSDHLGPWTKWAHDLDADLMVIGQDWGDESYFLSNKGADKPNNSTNRALQELLAHVGRPIGSPPSPFENSDLRSASVWLTNALLWLKTGGLSAAVKTEWFKDPAAKFLQEQIDIVRPRVVVALGSRAYHAVLFAFEMKDPRTPFRLIVEDRAGIKLPTSFDCTLFGVYHCGTRITGTLRSRAKQKEDWNKIRDALPDSRMGENEH